MTRIPSLRLSDYTEGDDKERTLFAEELYAALQEYGFFILTGHNVAQSKIDGAIKATKHFFSLPQDVKSRYNIPGSFGQRGYTGFGVEQAIKDNAPDPKEYWHVGREFFSNPEVRARYQQNVWPEESPGFRTALLELFTAMDRMSGALLAALGQALGTPEGYFEEFTQDGNCVLRCLHYPPVASSKTFGKAHYRAAPHKDINFFTCLVGETDSGLQFMDKDGSWLDVQAGPGAFVVDSGEMLSLITNDRIPATTHRVIKPEDDNSSRYSMVFLVHPRPDSELVCINSCKGDGEKYAPVSAHEFLLSRIEYWRQAGAQS